MLDSLDTLISFVLIMLVVSLVITIAVQMTSAVLNLRGLNLLNGLSSTFAAIAPDLKQNTKDLARLILKGPILSDSFLPNWPVISWWRHSSAIRTDEVFDAIHRIAAGRRSATDTQRKSAQALLVALGMDEKDISDAAAKLHRLHGLQEPAKGVADTAGETVRSLSNEKVRTHVQAAYQKFQYWTDICQ